MTHAKRLPLAALAALLLASGCNAPPVAAPKPEEGAASAKKATTDKTPPKATPTPAPQQPTGVVQPNKGIAADKLEANEATGMLVNKDTGALVRGTTVAMAGDKPLSPTTGNPNVTSAITTVDGQPVSYIYAGNTIFVEAGGLKPSVKYRATLRWPNGDSDFQDFTSDAGGNVSSPQGKFIEYAHTGFHNRVVTPGKASVVTGEYKVEINELNGKDLGALATSIPFAVKPRPIMFICNKENKERTLFFSTYAEELKLHGEGLPPDQKVLVSVIVADVNRLAPLRDGTTISDKVFEQRHNMAFKADANGIIDAPFLSWFKREAVKDSLVLIGKFLNGEDKYVEAEDIAISDHPTFLIKDPKEFFDAVNGSNGSGIGVPGATPPPAAPPPPAATGQ